MGGGATFLGLSPNGPSFLADLNAELIETYTQVRDDPQGVARELKLHENHENIKEYYYYLRAAKPNLPSERAARFIFLNRTSYNGIFRVNQNGDYNVPFGRGEPVIPTERELLAVSKRLQSAVLNPGDFAERLENVSPGDLVFLDPPYTVAHNFNGFVKYNQKLFSWKDQARLSKVVDKIKAKGALYVLTNAAHPSIAELFDKGDRRVELNRKNAIGGRSADRGMVAEYIFTNIGAP